MRPADNTDKLFKKLRLKASAQLDDRVHSDIARALDKSTETRPAASQPNIWRVIMKSKIPRLAAAAVIVIAAIIGIKGFNGTAAWADVVKAFGGAYDIHVVEKIVVRATGEVAEHEQWLRNNVMLREEHPTWIFVDDGVTRLTLHRKNKTAQLSDSYAAYEDYMTRDSLELVHLFTGEESRYTATELPTESNGTALVYEVTYRHGEKGKVWVDAKTSLPVRAVTTNDTEDREAVFDYDQIPLGTFDIAIPPGYAELPRLPSRLISGKLVDEQGVAVVGAEVYTSAVGDRVAGPQVATPMSKTNVNGEFTIKLPPNEFYPLEFPVVLRAFERDNPHRVAWRVIRTPDDCETVYCESIFGGQAREPWEIRGLVLEMLPASVIAGRVTDIAGGPIANATVWIESMNISGEYGLDLDSGTGVLVGATGYVEAGKAFTLSDDEGYYELSNLPRSWEQVRLEVKADGYVAPESTPETAFRHQVGATEQICDLVMHEASITIRGTVIDNYGAPLVGREVEVLVEGENLDDLEVIVDAQGRFKLIGLPMVSELLLRTTSDSKPSEWEENKLTRGREFIYYADTDVMMNLVPSKKDYWVELVPQRPDITIQIEVKDIAAKPMENIPIGVCSPGFTEGQWYATKLIGMTDMDGVCTITEVPRTEPCQLWICEPKGRVAHHAISQELRDAIAESAKSHAPMVVPVEFEPGTKEYEISVTLLEK
jgi:hypothetical protein